MSRQALMPNHQCSRLNEFSMPQCYKCNDSLTIIHSLIIDTCPLNIAHGGAP